MEAATSKTLMFWIAAVTCCIAAASSAVVPSGSTEKTQDLGGCLLSLTSVKGCVEAIEEAVSFKKFDELQQECCKAITLLGDNCWPILFPDQPIVPLLLKAVCKLLGDAEKVAEAPSPYY
ncbi:uncharacterized protein LOC120150408 [Hibiscus syriacus]|uniref:uncharacterized protein LOC120150408 n=1 Tax=Hibiscus syriacus TaxID=106335 RepID=UPI00192070EB|nr:uncharacterized protein LOC120150408 [Hibiscus syriacus]